MTRALQERLIDAAAAVIAGNAERLTALDRAIGDGDHGINMQRGFAAVAARRDEIAAEPPGRALHSAGMVLVMTVGGASGPLYGSLLMAMGKTLGGSVPDRRAVAAMVESGVAAVRARGRSDAGEKTMLDVLVPVAAALRRGCADGLDRAALLASVRAAADDGLERTRVMRATKGRAAFLGDRSIGHLDPGAQSCRLLVGAVCDAVGAQP